MIDTIIVIEYLLKIHMRRCNVWIGKIILGVIIWLLIVGFICLFFKGVSMNESL